MRQERVPRKLAEFVEFLDQKGPKWKLRAEDIGLTPAQGSSAEATAAALRAQFDARVQAEEDLRIAVSKLTTGAVEARRLTGDLIRLIDGFAANSADPTEVYALAEIPAPLPPSPVGSPGLPEAFKVTLDQTGALNLSWKCPNPKGSTGVVYEVMRGFSSSGPFSYLGVTATRKFSDTTVPSGSGVVAYQITGVRSNTRGPAARFTVQFGNGGGGMAITNVTTQGLVSGKLAA
jgi:hypothetical protein